MTTHAKGENEGNGKSRANGGHPHLSNLAVSDLTKAHPALKDNRTTPSLPSMEVNGCRLLMGKAKTYEFELTLLSD